MSSPKGKKNLPKEKSTTSKQKPKTSEAKEKAEENQRDNAYKAKLKQRVKFIDSFASVPADSFYSPLNDPGVQAIHSRVFGAVVDLPSVDMMTHDQLRVAGVTGHKLYNVYFRVMGVVPSIIATIESYTRERMQLIAFQTTQLRVGNQDARDLMFKCSAPYRLDNVPDPFANAYTPLKTVTAPAASQSPSKVIFTLSKPNGSYPVTMLENPLSADTNKPEAPYMHVAQFVVTADELSIGGDSTKPGVYATLSVSCKAVVGELYAGATSTFPDVIVSPASFDPTIWPDVEGVPVVATTAIKTTPVSGEMTTVKSSLVEVASVPAQAFNPIPAFGHIYKIIDGVLTSMDQARNRIYSANFAIRVREKIFFLVDDSSADMYMPYVTAGVVPAKTKLVPYSSVALFKYSLPFEKLLA